MKTSQTAQAEVFFHIHGVLGPCFQLLLWHLIHIDLCQNYLIMCVLLISVILHLCIPHKS